MAALGFGLLIADVFDFVSDKVTGMLAAAGSDIGMTRTNVIIFFSLI